MSKHLRWKFAHQAVALCSVCDLRYLGSSPKGAARARAHVLLSAKCRMAPGAGSFHDAAVLPVSGRRVLDFAFTDAAVIALSPVRARGVPPPALPTAARPLRNGSCPLRGALPA